MFTATANATDLEGSNITYLRFYYANPSGQSYPVAMCGNQESSDTPSSVTCEGTFVAGELNFKWVGTWTFYSIEVGDSWGNQANYRAGVVLDTNEGSSTHDLNLPDIELDIEMNP